MNPPLTAQVPEPTEAHKTLAAKITDIYIEALRSPDVRPTRRVAKLLASSFPGSSPTPETQPAGEEPPEWGERATLDEAERLVPCSCGAGYHPPHAINCPRRYTSVRDVNAALARLLTSRPQQPVQTQKPAGTERVDYEREAKLWRECENVSCMLATAKPHPNNQSAFNTTSTELWRVWISNVDAERRASPSQPPQPAQATELKRESFTEAVMNSGMTEAQQAPLLAMVAEEKAHQIVSCWLSGLEGYDAATRGTPKLIKAVAQAITEARFAPMGDNHHNAAACPYCSPKLQPKENPEPKQGVARGGEDEPFEFAANPGTDADYRRADEQILMLLYRIGEQCGKEHYFNALHHTGNLIGLLASFLRAALASAPPPEENKA